MHLEAALAADIDRQVDHLVDLRRSLHARPELSFEEVQTTRTVRSGLQALGLTLRTCPTETGAVAVLDGAAPGPTVLLRADIDALPVQEATGLAFASELEGRMHACGHDAHTAILLGVAAALAGHADGLRGRYVFVFQPGEERISGAQAMVDGGLLEGLDPMACLGLHVFTGAPTGVVGTRPGLLMAGARGLRITVRGSGGHGALQPRQGNVILAAARIADRLESVVEGMVGEGTPFVCSPGMIAGGSAPNVVPTAAEVAATLRWFDDAGRDEALRRLGELAHEVGEDFGVEVGIETDFATGPVRNDPGVVDVVLDAAASLVPPVVPLRLPSPVPASDDVSVLLERVPGCYVMIGAALADGSSGPHHSPSFAVDETALAIGAQVLARAAARLGAGLPA